MKRKVFIACLLLLVFASIAATTSMKAVKAPRGVMSPFAQPERTTIDGKLKPEKIPDHIAYSALFRLIAKRDTEAEKQRGRAYIRQALGCTACSNQSKPDKSRESEEADIDALIAAAEDFNQQVSILDSRAVNIQARYHPEHAPLSPEDQKQLKLLKNEKKAIVTSIIDSLPRRLTAEGFLSLKRHIKDHMKHRIKWSTDQETE